MRVFLPFPSLGVFGRSSATSGLPLIFRIAPPSLSAVISSRSTVVSRQSSSDPNEEPVLRREPAQEPSPSEASVSLLECRL